MLQLDHCILSSPTEWRGEEGTRIHASWCINDQLQVGDNSLLFSLDIGSVEKEAYFCGSLILIVELDWGAGVWLHFRLSLVMCRAVQWPVCQQTSATQLWSKLNTCSCLRLWCSLHSGLNENLSEMSLLSHPRQYIEPRAFWANNTLLRYSVIQSSVSQYIELGNTKRKVWECRNLNLYNIGDYLYTVDIRHSHCSLPFSFFLVEYKRGKKVPWNGRLLKRLGLNIVCGGCSSGSDLFRLI